jgi:hypothetical protein
MTTTKTMKSALLNGGAVVLLIAGGLAISSSTGLVGFPLGMSSAYAESHEGGGGSAGGGKGKHGGEVAQGQGGPGADSDGRGPKYKAGKDVDGEQGGKPVWAQEGIPEVELGRLNVARSPSNVLDRQLAEALATLKALDAETLTAVDALYNGSADAFIAAVSTQWDTLTYIDSPLQNLAVLRDVFDGEGFLLNSVGVYTTSPTEIASILIGVASDKTVAITDDTVKALNTILGLGLTDPEITYIADK